MKVAIFETEHFEGAFPVIRLFDMPGNEISIYTSAETHQRFLDLLGKDSAKYNWVILPTGSRARFFYSLYKKLKKEKPALFYINTISNNHLLYAWVLQLTRLERVVLTVHDINCLFESRPHLNFRQNIVHRGKRKLVGQVHEFNVVADTMIPYLQTKINRKRYHNLPGAVFEDRHTSLNISSGIKIVVPGSLDKRRRDYNQVFELAALSAAQGFNLQITLLGGYSDAGGRAIADQANAFRPGQCVIHRYQQEVVDQKEFDEQMDAAHFVFIPSVIHTAICGDIPEVYGITKSSGNIFDVIKHAKPFIVPEALTVPVNLQTSCFKYTTVMDIVSFFKKLIGSPGHYDFWQNNALENSKNYTIEKVRAKNSSLFRQ